MNTLRFFVLFFLLIINSLLAGQSLSPTVISTAGGYAVTPAGSISHTTGELAAIETHMSNEIILTQGFQQPWTLPSSNTTEILKGFRFTLFPNPSDGQTTIDIEYPEDLDLQIHVRDIVGKLVLYTDLHHQAPRSTFPFYIRSASSGTYVLTMTAKNPATQNIHRFYQTLILTK